MSDRRKPAVLAGFRRRVIDPERLREFADTGRRLERERAEAAAVVEKVLKETPAEQWPALAERADLQTCGALERLGNYVAEVLGRDPRHARAVAELAVSTAEAIPESVYPAAILAQLRAHAWKDLAKALLYVGKFPDALNAVDRADAHILLFGSLGHDHAIVGLVRAEILQQVDRYDEALAVLAECKRIFRGHSDDRRLLLAGIAEGVLLHRLRKFREAREAYLLLLASMQDVMDQDSAACLHNVIGHCSVELGDFDAAETYLSRAIALFNELGHALQAAKAELGRGRMFVRSGRVDRGVAHLRPVRAQFLRGGLVEEAGLCGLEIVEGLLIARRCVRGRDSRTPDHHRVQPRRLSANARSAPWAILKKPSPSGEPLRRPSLTCATTSSRSGRRRSESSSRSPDSWKRLGKRNSQSVTQSPDDLLHHLNDALLAVPPRLVLFPRERNRAPGEREHQRNGSHTSTRQFEYTTHKPSWSGLPPVLIWEGTLYLAV